MKLWLISQTQNDNYDTYDSAVVAAETEDQARNTGPEGAQITEWANFWEWCSGPEHVTVKYIGEAAPGTEPGVILASFNAG